MHPCIVLYGWQYYIIIWVAIAHIPAKLIEEAVKEILDHMAITLAKGERIEIRGFGSFSLISAVTLYFQISFDFF